MNLTYTQLTTLAGALIAIALGTVDAWVFHAFGYDQLLIGSGLAALLASNPIPVGTALAPAAAEAVPVPPNPSMQVPKA